jgi:mRNA interferase MazF
VIRRGDVFFVDLNPVKGREQAGRRPVLVVSADALNAQPLVVTVVVGTDASNVPRNYPVNVRVPAASSGLPLDTVFLCFQLRSLDPSRFAGAPAPVAHLDDETMAAVDRALRLVLRLP